MNDHFPFEHVRVVLSRPSHPGNIGAAARAMKTMGLSRLWLVSPHSFPDPVAEARAHSAADVLAGARVVDTLQEALAGTIFSAALTARRRDLSLPRAAPRAAAAELVEWSAHGETALVFGNETSGLTNQELALCARPVTIPTHPGYSSLNLGAAVQLMCYELRLAALAQNDTAPFPESLPNLATHDEIEGFFGHLESSIIASGFLDTAKPRRLMAKLRRLFNRARLEKEEVAILRGVLASFK